jgi:hypothetical protein
MPCRNVIQDEELPDPDPNAGEEAAAEPQEEPELTKGILDKDWFVVRLPKKFYVTSGRGFWCDGMMCMSAICMHPRLHL